jgi:hypothetical protein
MTVVGCGDLRSLPPITQRAVGRNSRRRIPPFATISCRNSLSLIAPYDAASTAIVTSAVGLVSASCRLRAGFVSASSAPNVGISSAATSASRRRHVGGVTVLRFPPCARDARGRICPRRARSLQKNRVTPVSGKRGGPEYSGGDVCYKSINMDGCKSITKNGYTYFITYCNYIKWIARNTLALRGGRRVGTEARFPAEKRHIAGEGAVAVVRPPYGDGREHRRGQSAGIRVREI